MLFLLFTADVILLVPLDDFIPDILVPAYMLANKLVEAVAWRCRIEIMV